ncbi:hypothetical protein ACFL1H_04310 [Nanoarchaeota archaeon]
MFKWYGILGIIGIIFVQLNFVLRIEPFASYYFIIVWPAYILLMDAIVYHISRKSYINDQPMKLLFLFFISAVLWWIYEFINVYVGNWNYNTVTGWEALGGVWRKSLYFSTVLPALFLTAEFVKSLHIFDKLKLKHKHKISKVTIYSMIVVGLICFVLPVLWPIYFYPLIWLIFFLILDPINYMHKEPSLLQHFVDRKVGIILILALAGLICGFLWEFWNFLAINKWHYNIPFLGFFKVFEMPILGYLGYIPFAWSLYAVYHFINSLFKKREKDII